MNVLLRGVWNFTETALRLPSSKCPVFHAVAAEAWLPVRPVRRHRKYMSCGWSAAVCGLICHRKPPSQCCWKWRFKCKWIAYFFFCGGYFKNSGGLSDMNFEPVVLNKTSMLPYLLQRFTGTSFLWRYCVLDNVARQPADSSSVVLRHWCPAYIMPQTRRPQRECETPYKNWIAHCLWLLGVRILCTRNRDSVPRRGWFFFSTESREGLGTAQSRSWHSCWFSSTIRTAYVHTYCMCMHAYLLINACIHT
jgi:hypothetical protein